MTCNDLSLKNEKKNGKLSRGKLALPLLRGKTRNQKSVSFLLNSLVKEVIYISVMWILFLNLSSTTISLGQNALAFDQTRARYPNTGGRHRFFFLKSVSTVNRNSTRNERFTLLIKLEVFYLTAIGWVHKPGFVFVKLASKAQTLCKNIRGWTLRTLPYSCSSVLDLGA